MSSSTLGGTVNGIARGHILPPCREGRVSKVLPDRLEVAVRSLSGDVQTLAARGWHPAIEDTDDGPVMVLPKRGDRAWVADDEGRALVVVAWERIGDSDGVAFGQPPVTSLPGSPANGQACNLLVNSSAVMWQLVYNAANSRWYFVGGSFYRGAFDGTGRTISATSLADVPSTTAGITVPFAGRYDVEAFFGAVVPGAADLLFVGATGVTETALDQATALSVPALVTGEATYTASQAIKPQAYRSAANGAVNNVRLGIRPVYLT